MAFQVNPLGRMVNNYLMKWALPLAGWFIVEYLVRNASSTNMMLGLLSFPMMMVTVWALWWIIRKLRREILADCIHGIQAWSFGVQLMFFAGLIEALFIYIYNEYLFPGNLVAVQQAAIAQYESVLGQLTEMGAYQSWIPKFQETLDAMKEMPLQSAIDTAIGSLSNDIFAGMFIMIPLALILRKRPKADIS